MTYVLLPPRIRTWSQGDLTLYFDPSNFCWARVNASGVFILKRLQRFRTVEAIAEEVSASFGLSTADALAAVEGFIRPLLDAGFLHSGEYRERQRPHFSPRTFAHTVYLHMTNDCNLKCPYCYNKSDREFKIGLQKKGRFAPILSTGEYKVLIARLLELGAEHLVFTGGEPLMRPDIVELLEFTRSTKSEVEIEILSNAILIREALAERLCDLADAVTISMDGHERHLHEHYRGRNTFAPTIRGIRTLVETRHRRGQVRPYISLVPALTDKNIAFMKDIYEFSLEQLAVDGLAPILFQAGDHQELNLRQIPELATWTEAQRDTLAYLQDRAGRTGEVKQGSPPSPPRNQCGVGNGEFSIDPSGYVYPCQSLHFDEFLCGNARTQDIKDIFEQSEVMLRVRGTVVDRLAVCRHCDLKYLCNGGCRATAYNIYRQFDAHNEIYCGHLEKIAVDKMWATVTARPQPSESVCV